MPLVSIIVATDERGAIGRDGGLPWRLPDDLKRFKALTMGKPIDFPFLDIANLLMAAMAPDRGAGKSLS